MTRIKRLELENAVLRNVIACALEKKEIAERTRENPQITLERMTFGLDFESKMEAAMELGEAIDYRLSANTLGGCEGRLESLGSRVVLNDGMVMEIEY